MKYELAVPYASSLIESLRAFGYDLPTALADLIDNSIYADATEIWIEFLWDGENSTVTITDNGRGMNDKDLVEAMRPGSKNPLEDRDANDLGRFGLGLKTASFSQCRCLTVRSKVKNGNTATRCWDLAYVAKTNEWRLLDQSGIESDKFKRLATLVSGTAVLWENMDHVVKGTDVKNEADHNIFLERIEQVREHLAMVFHRFMEGRNALKIRLNEKMIEPWDPFLTSEKATQVLAEESLQIFKDRIIVIPYVLPHISKMDKDRHEAASGIKGWNAHQGFYVYRNKRMLVHGDWLGLPFAKEEHFKLARILVDIPNSMDHEWDIDVRKSKARPPDALRPDLKRIAALTRRKASDIYRHRGKVVSRENSASHVFVWERKVKHGKTFYSVNRKHPLVAEILENSGELKKQINAMLRLLEETIPVTWIVMNNAEKPDQHSIPFEGQASAQVMEVMKQIYAALLRSGQSPVAALERLRNMDPFEHYPALLQVLTESIKDRENA